MSLQLRALYRLGLRVVQFSTQTCFNAYADSEAGGPPIWHGINERGHELVGVMNDLGILIDITHATQRAQEQILAASSRPVVASHTSLAAVSGHGMADSTLKLDPTGYPPSKIKQAPTPRDQIFALDRSREETGRTGLRVAQK